MFGGADLVVTDQAAKLGYPVTRLGLSPAVSSPFLTHQVSGSWLRRLMLDPGLISGAEAAAIGLAHVCVPTPEEVLPAALAAASELAEKPPGAIAATKAWLREIEAWKSSSGHAARGLAVSVATGEAPESRERIAALKFG
jgi:enoyl-CoA hydratase/carnithine racemase